MTHEDSVPLVNQATGATKGTKMARFDLIPVGPLTEVAVLLGKGAAKYAERNWELGHDYNLFYASMQRHANAWWSGEDKDPELGTSHLASVIFNAMALMQLQEQHPELDNRPIFDNRPVFGDPS